jgi:alpha-beta hydrolase superfamily lysophospholipase
MMNEKGKGTYKGSNGLDTITYFFYKPKESPKAILQISHGMAEHMGRYQEFASFLAERGYLVCGNDHLGHGETSATIEDFGYFGKEKGWIHMVDDMHLLTVLMKKTFGDVPYFIIGNSMGSLLLRAYLTSYGHEISGAILMATSGRSSLAKVAMPLINLIGALKGQRHRSNLLYSVAFGNYTKMYEKGCNKLAWMSQDSKVLAAFEADSMCNFVFTVAGYRDLTEVLLFVSRPEWAQELPRNLPIYLISGSMDPVGEYGKGVQQVYKALLEAKIKDLSMKLYPDDRHEILNEPHKETVYQDIFSWMEKHL